MVLASQAFAATLRAVPMSVWGWGSFGCGLALIAWLSIQALLEAKDNAA